MKKVSLDTWIQLIGMLGVLGGLIFVGLEMQQTQRLALAAQANARTEMLMERNLVGFQGRAELLHKITSARNEELTDFELYAKGLMDRWVYALQANNFFQYELGLLDEEQWLIIEERIIRSWEDCDLRGIYMEFPNTEFSRYLMTLPDNCVK